MPETTVIYKMPRGVMPRREEARKLYELEEARDAAIKAAAKELQHFIAQRDGRDVSFWGEAMPEALLNILDSFVRDASINAAIAFLTRLLSKALQDILD